MINKKSPAIRQNDKLQSVPGIGIAGLVMCPYFKSTCLKHGCELWVELNYGEQKVARCSIAWQSILITELRLEIEKLRKGIK